MTYADKLKDPRWQKKRLEIIKDRNGVCEICCEDRGLHVHHDRYTGEPWEAPNKDLVLLCRDCHNLMHRADIKAYEVIDARNLVDYPFYEESLAKNLKVIGYNLFENNYPAFIKLLVKFLNDAEDLSIKDFMEKNDGMD